MTNNNQANEGQTKMAKKNTARKVEMESINETATTEVNEVVESTVVVNPVQLDEKGRKKEVRMSMEQLEQLGLKNKSQMIRYLIAEGHSPSAVAKFLGVIYQHVRNVMFQQLKRPAPEVKAVETEETTADE